MGAQFKLISDTQAVLDIDGEQIKVNTYDEGYAILDKRGIAYKRKVGSYGGKIIKR